MKLNAIIYILSMAVWVGAVLDASLSIYAVIILWVVAFAGCVVSCNITAAIFSFLASLSFRIMDPSSSDVFHSEVLPWVCKISAFISLVIYMTKFKFGRNPMSLLLDRSSISDDILDDDY